MRSCEHFDRAVDGERNLILICSPKSNDICRDVLFKTRERLVPRPRSQFGFKEAVRDEDWEIEFCEFSSPSPSFQEEREGADELHDFALLAKLPNPYNDHAKVLIVAGIRAFGTWGAAKYLLEHSEELHESFKDHNFATVLKVTYSASRWAIKDVVAVGHSVDLGSMSGVNR